MTDPEPVPRPGLFTNGDFDSWVEQVLFLRMVLRMPLWQIAAIDHGILPEHEDAAAIPFLDLQYGRMFADLESLDVAAEIERIRHGKAPSGAP